MNTYKVDSPYLGRYYCNKLDMYKVMGIALYLNKEDAVNLVLEATSLVTDDGTKYHYVPVDKDYVLSLLGREVPYMYKYQQYEHHKVHSYSSYRMIPTRRHLVYFERCRDCGYRYKHCNRDLGNSDLYRSLVWDYESTYRNSSGWKHRKQRHQWG